MNTDDTDGLHEATLREIEELQKVTREKDGDEAYALAKFNIGKKFEELGVIEEALESWYSIKKSDSKEGYPIARFRIGQALKNQGSINAALEVWQSIERMDDTEWYAIARNCIAAVLEEQRDIEEALKIWYKITREDDPHQYVIARQSIGWALNAQGNMEDALNVWDSITREDNAEGYASVKLMSGWVLEDKGKIDRALEAWYEIQKIDSSKWYASAQVSIGQALTVKGDIKGALETWSRIEQEDDPESYAFAQHAIGRTLRSQGDIQSALKAWQNIQITDSEHFFAYAQFYIATILINKETKSDVENAKDAFRSASAIFPYEAYCYEKICDLILKPNTDTVGKKSLQLLDKTLEIVSILKLDFGQDSNEEKLPERKLAHYTSTDTANLLLEREEEKNLPSAFRLNTINNVNDPSEGQLLLNYLKDIKEKSFHSPDFDEKLHAFIGCFTFNHDSLNQFRLYGKQDHKEASGVSLVFKKEFFQSNDLSGGLSFLSIGREPQHSNNNLVINSFDKESIIKKETSEKISLSKKPVMRCVYLDPTSDYIHLAQRNRLTFFREFGDEKIEIEMSESIKEINWADIEWEKYKFELRRKTKDFEKAFKELKEIYKDLNSKVSVLKDIESTILNSVETLSNEILLPLKYLIKHSAFQEEQECRIVYVTSINAPEVIMQHKKFLFVEYKAEVKENLNKVYIAPAATEYQLYLAWLLRNTDIKIELSNNPYRQT